MSKNLKQLRKQIRSVSSIQKTTKAIQMIAAAKFNKMKNLVSYTAYQAETLNNIISKIMLNIDPRELSITEKKFFFNDPLNSQTLLVLICTDKGFCGSINTSLIKKLKNDIEILERSKKLVRLIIIGKKGIDILKADYSSYIEDYFDYPKDALDIDTIIEIKDRILRVFVFKDIGSCYLYFNNFKNKTAEIPTVKGILPIPSFNTGINNTIELEGKGFINNIVNLHISSCLSSAILLNKVSEEKARMVSMDLSTKNAKQMYNDLTIKLNRLRQGMVTKELIEVVSGAEVL